MIKRIIVTPLCVLLLVTQMIITVSASYTQVGDFFADYWYNYTTDTGEYDSYGYYLVDGSDSTNTSANRRLALSSAGTDIFVHRDYTELNRDYTDLGPSGQVDSSVKWNGAVEGWEVPAGNHVVWPTIRSPYYGSAANYARIPASPGSSQLNLNLYAMIKGCFSRYVGVNANDTLKERILGAGGGEVTSIEQSNKAEDTYVYLKSSGTAKVFWPSTYRSGSNRFTVEDHTSEETAKTINWWKSGYAYKKVVVTVSGGSGGGGNNV